MPKFQVTSPDGQSFSVEGDTPPTESDLDEIFKSSRRPAATALESDAGFHIATSEKPLEQLGPEKIINKGMELAGRGLIGAANLVPKAESYLLGRGGKVNEARMLKYGEPLFHLAEPLTPEEEASVPPQAAGVYRSLTKAADALTTPEMLATLPLAGLKPIQAAFATQMAANLPDQVKRAADVLDDPKASTLEKWEAVTDPAISGVMTGLLAKNLAKKGVNPNAIQERSAETVPMEEPPGGSPEVGARVPQPETPAEAQAPANVPPKEESIKEQQFDDLHNNWFKNENPGKQNLLRELISRPEHDETDIRGNFEGEDVNKALNYYRLAKELYGTGRERRSNQLSKETSPEPAIRDSVAPARVEEPSSEAAPEPTGAAPTEIDPIESWLNNAIDKTDPGQQLGGSEVSLGLAKLPVWLSKEVAHNSLKIIRAAYRTSKDVAQAIRAGVDWLKQQNLKDFNEDEAHAWMVSSLKDEGSNTTGIAQRVREKRAAAGKEELSPIGQGISAPDSVEQGEKLLQADPTIADKHMTAFENDPNKAVSSEGMATARAKDRQLSQAAKAAEGTPGYEAAFKVLSDWKHRIKKMQTEWHKTGMAQQGEQDIDTGTFTGLREAYTKDTGKDFTPEQKGTAKKVAKKVNDSQKEVEAAKTKLAGQLQQDRTPAEQRAMEAAWKAVADLAVQSAKAENAARVAQAERDVAVRNVQEKAAEKAKQAASKAVGDAAIQSAKAENKARIDAAERKLEAAKVQEQAAKRAFDAANKAAGEAAIRAAKADVDARVNPEKRVWAKVGDYLDQGMDNFDDIRSKVATDLGMSVKKVTDLLTQNKRTKFLADDLWKKQEAMRRFKAQAERWLKSTALPGYQKALATIPRTLFALKVGFHGTVALGTHAPMVAFQPRFWAAYFRDFGKMYHMVASPKYYEMQVQELLRRPNYIRARRAGLVNDPSSYEDYNSPTFSQYIGRLSGMGNRGYSVLKILRQDMFDQHWNQLPKTAQIDEMASAIADGVNHATGVVKGAAPKGANVVLFAPRLEASRVMWLAGDPLRAADTFVRWNNATEAEKYFAVNQVKEKAWVAGTMLGLLALNQGILSATDSDQKINFTDPFHSDWLKFKAAGMTASYGNAMLTMARLPVRLYKIRQSDGGKLKNLVYPDENSYSVLGEYARSQLSPFASLATDIWLKGDWQNRPLPSSTRPVPKRLRAQGVQPYTWPEFWTEQALPIPAEEATREVWKHGLGMSDEQVKSARKALATIAVMSATGARLTDDIPAQKKTGQ